ncbi:MAG: site-specific integrase, partial [Gammaproteobacteria bacterium]|nr:site-specific integrase [Gammaproteobacteria bacterium]
VRLRDALLDRAAFYLMWQGGLRLGEVHALCLEDVDLAGCRLTIRDGKGRKDRTIYLTDRVVTSVQAYLELRGISTYDQVFLYRHRPLKKDLVPARLKAAGQRVGVKVSSHRLRHTYATQLLNAGCPVTSIQKLLGHRDLNMTMVYARVHNRTVADDYYAAMKWIEQGLNLAGSVADESQGNQPDRNDLLDLTDQLAEPDLTQETRLALVAQLRDLLLAETSSETEQPLVMIMPAPVLDTVATSG